MLVFLGPKSGQCAVDRPGDYSPPGALFTMSSSPATVSTRLVGAHRSGRSGGKRIVEQARSGGPRGRPVHSMGKSVVSRVEATRISPITVRSSRRDCSGQHAAIERARALDAAHAPRSALRADVGQIPGDGDRRATTGTPHAHAASSRIAGGARAPTHTGRRLQRIPAPRAVCDVAITLGPIEISSAARGAPCRTSCPSRDHRPATTQTRP